MVTTRHGIRVFEDTDECATCGGECCQNAPGNALPEDVHGGDEDELRERLEALLATGRWTIEHGIETPGLWGNWIVRPAIKGDEGQRYTEETHGLCTFWSANGCEIFEQRPTGCRALKPQFGKQCSVPSIPDEHRLQDAWQPHFDMLRELAGVDE